MSMLNIRIAALSVLLSAGSSVFAQSHATQTQEFIEQTQARQAALDIAAAPIKSRADLFAYLHGVAAPLSPLSKLSPGARDRFLASLTFNENGITGFSYEDLKNELSPMDIYKVLTLFGAQRDIALIRGLRAQNPSDALLVASPSLAPDDHEGYACVGRATCNVRPSYICMSGC